MNEFDRGRLTAYQDVLAHAAAMIKTEPNNQAWFDMAMFAHAGIEDILDPLDIPEDSDVQLMYESDVA